MRRALLALLAVICGAGVAPALANAAGTGTISGRVTDAAGEPIAHTEVCAWPADGGPVLVPAGYHCPETNDAGEYSITGLYEGTYEVTFTGKVCLGEACTQPYVRQKWQASPSDTAPQSITIASGSHVSNIDAQLTEGGRIEGMARNSQGEGIEDLQVCALKDSKIQESCTRTTSGGTYTLEGLGKWPVIVRVYSGQLYADTYYGDVLAAPEATVLEVGPGEILTGIDVTMAEGGRISGDVTDATGEPIAHTQVCAAPVTFSTNFSERCASTDAAGQYSITGLDDGTYEVEFTGEVCPISEVTQRVETYCTQRRYLTTWWPSTTSFERGQPITIADGSTASDVDARLTLGGEVTGVVKDEGLPVKGALVCVGFKTPIGSVNSCARTGADGSYAVGGLPSGQYDLEVWITTCRRLEGSEPECRSEVVHYPEVTVTAPDTTTGINLELDPLAPAAAAAPTVAGVPAAGHELVCSPGEWTEGAHGFVFEWLRDGAPIPGQVSATYVVQTADEGHEVACRVTVYNSGGSAEATSNSIQIPEAPTPIGPGSPGGDMSRDQPRGNTESTAPQTAGKGNGRNSSRPNGHRASGGKAKRGRALAAQVGRVRGRRATVQLRCAGAGPCKGRLDLLEHATGHSSGSHGKPHAGAVKIGSAGFALAKGAKRTVRVRLSANALRAVRAAGSHGMAVQVGGVDVRRRRVILKVTGKPARSRQVSEP